MRSSRSSPIRRAATAALAGAMILTLLPAAPSMAASTGPAAMKTAEWELLRQMNKYRARHGVAPLRMAYRVRLAARDRSRSMRNQGYFGHVSPAGVDAGDLMDRRRLRYRYWGENIGWTKYYDLDQGVTAVVDGWMNSPGHRRNILDRDLNYVGVGIAKQGPQLYYTAVYSRLSDRTPPMAGMVGHRDGISVASTSGKRTSVTVRWWGKDRKLSAGTAGVRGFTVQVKRGNGQWRTLFRNTKARRYTAALREGTYTFRVKATDRRGNRSSWKRPVTVTVR